MEPIIKWAGGKRRFVDQIIKVIGDKCDSYYEPFLGGAAVLYRIKAKKYYCSDINEELINFYEVVKNNADELIQMLKNDFLPNHSKDFYMSVRDLDRNVESFKKLSSVYKAARFLYLNKTCFNGLWRVNSKGENNVPMGRYTNPKILDKESLLEASIFFKKNKVNFMNCSYDECVKGAKAGDLVYFDPPYDIEEGQNSFTAYSKSKFNRKDQKALKKLCDSLIVKGVRVAISNSNTNFIQKLYSGNEYITYTIYNKIVSNRTIGASVDSRRKVTELLIVGGLKQWKNFCRKQTACQLL